MNTPNMFAFAKWKYDTSSMTCTQLGNISAESSLHAYVYVYITVYIYYIVDYINIHVVLRMSS